MCTCVCSCLHWKLFTNWAISWASSSKCFKWVTKKVGKESHSLGLWISLADAGVSLNGRRNNAHLSLIYIVWFWKPTQRKTQECSRKSIPLVSMIMAPILCWLKDIFFNSWRNISINAWLGEAWKLGYGLSCLLSLLRLSVGNHWPRDNGCHLEGLREASLVVLTMMLANWNRDDRECALISAQSETPCCYMRLGYLFLSCCWGSILGC